MMKTEYKGVDIYDNKEEAEEILLAYFGKDECTTKKIFHILENSYSIYSYEELKFIENYIFTGYCDKNGEVKIIPFFDVIRLEKGFTPNKEYLLKQATTPSERGAAYSILMSMEMINDNYFSALNLLKEAIKDFLDTKSDYQQIYFSFNSIPKPDVADESSLRTAAAHLLCAILAAEVDPKNEVKLGIPGFLMSYAHFLYKYNFKKIIMSNLTLYKMHKLVMSKYKNEMNKYLMRRKVVMDINSIDIIESDPSYIHSLLVAASRGTWIMHVYPDFVDTIKKNEDRIIRIFRNYFFSKFKTNKNRSDLKRSLTLLQRFLKEYFPERNIAEVLENTSDIVTGALLEVMIEI